MSDTAGLERAKGTLIHWWRHENHILLITLLGDIDSLATASFYVSKRFWQLLTFDGTNMHFSVFTYQAYENTEQLDHICVGDRVKSSDKSVEDGYQCWDHHWHVDIYVHDHAESGTCKVLQSFRISLRISSKIGETWFWCHTIITYLKQIKWLQTRRFLP